MDNVLFVEIVFLGAIIVLDAMGFFSSRANVGVVLISLIYHTVFSCAYMYYSKGADALDYYSYAINYHGSCYDLYGVGTTFIRFVVYLFANVLGLSYLSLFMLFNLFGYCGLMLFYLSVREQINGAVCVKSLRNLNVFLFIPGLNFWTGAIGKDSMIFMGIGMLLYSLSNLQKRIVLFMLSLLLIYHIRPHVFLVVLVSLAVALMLREGAFRVINICILTLLLATIYHTKDAVFDYMRTESFSNISSVTDYLDKRQEYNLEGGSSVDISQLSFIPKVATYLYLPLFNGVQNIAMMGASLENALYVIISLHLFSLPVMTVLRRRSLYLLFGAIFFVVMLVVLSWSTANLGIAVRQKTMFIIILLAYHCISMAHKEKTVELCR